jgi:hypothetical protein
MPTTLRNVFQNAEITHAQRARLRTVKKAGKAAPSDMDYELVARGLLVAVVATDGPLTVALNPDAEGVFNENGTCVLPIVGGPVQSYLVDVLPPDSTVTDDEPFTYTPILYAATDDIAREKVRTFYGDRAIALWAQTSVDEYRRRVDL